MNAHGQRDSGRETRTPVSREHIEDYARTTTRAEPAYLQRLRERTREQRGGEHLLVDHVPGRLLTLLTALAQPRVAVEIGTFTGYATLCIAEALPPGARLLSCDSDARAHAIAREALAQSPFSERVELHTGTAVDFLSGLDTPIDLAFIDADKRAYARYYEMVLERMPAGGLIVLDNMLMRDGVFSRHSPQARAIDDLNRFLAKDERVENVFLPLRDGMQLVRKR